jgi:hypothetical protein
MIWMPAAEAAPFVQFLNEFRVRKGVSEIANKRPRLLRGQVDKGE